MTRNSVAAWVRLIFVFVLMTGFSLVLIPVQLAALRYRKPLARRIARTWHKTALALIGVRVKTSGAPYAGRPVLIVSNHVSWSDILVLGSRLEACFIARSDMETWPVLGQLAKLQETVFVNRGRKGQSRAQADAIAERLVKGDAMVLFAEGTTGDGVQLLPFKSALFGAVHAALDKAGLDEIVVQPVALAYTRLHGMPLGRFHQARAAWPGVIALWPHLFSFVADGAYDAEIVFCTPMTFSRDTPRKEMAEVTRQAVRQAFSNTMRMR